MKTTKQNSPTQFFREESAQKLDAGAKVLTFCVKTFGCQMNFYDSECIAGQMIAEGFEQITDTKCAMNQADIILFNTCSVREHAEQRFYKNLIETGKLKEKNQELIVGVCGCVAEQEGTKLFDKYPWIKLIVGPGNISMVGNAVKRIIENKSRIVMVGFSENIKGKCNHPPSFATAKLNGGVTTSTKNKISVLIPVVRGCNNFCSYCVVPYLRGREQSRPTDEIIDEVKQAAKNGCKEVMLLGQNVCAYKDSSKVKSQKSKLKGNDFAELLKKINDIEGIERIKFMTSHPRDVDEELIDVVANLDKVCKEFHLPVQSGSNKILKEMNRGYTREDYINLINKIRTKIKGVRITTDLIVGFPGETEEDFGETLDLIKKIKFDDAFTFKYSDRPGTRADKKDDKVPQEIKEKRLKILMETIRVTPTVSPAVGDSKQRN